MNIRILLIAALAAAYDYNLFVVQWKPSQCVRKSSHCAKGFLSNDFSIHGLWPENFNGSWPQDCYQDHDWSETDLKREFRLTDDLEEKLRKNWSSYKPDSRGFWKHEWDKHGTCFEPNTGSIDFFELVLKQFDLYNVKQDLENAGIVPASGNGYDKNDIQNAFSKRVTIDCRKISKRIYLDSIFVCLDKDLNVIDCFEEFRGPCGNNILYPEYTPGRDDL